VAECPACVEKRCHTWAEWQYHPLVGHGFTMDTGWTHANAGGRVTVEVVEPKLLPAPVIVVDR